MHAIAPEAYNSYPFFGERGMLHRQLATASVRTAGACKLLYIYRHNFGRFLHLVPDFASRVKFVAETRVKLNALRDQQVEAAGERSRALEQGYEAAVVTELLNQPSMRRCCGVVTRIRTGPTLAAGSPWRARPGSLRHRSPRCLGPATLWAARRGGRPSPRPRWRLPGKVLFSHPSRRTVRAAEKELQLEHAHRFNVAVGDTSAKHAYLKKSTTNL